jgi:hypothetical protein
MIDSCMRLSSSLRRLASFAALVAVAAATFVPAASHALGQSKGTKWIEVCSSAGSIQVEVPADGPGIPRAPKASDFDHCPFCTPHAGAMAPPPVPIALPLPDVRAGIVPALLLAAPRPLHAWASAQPRAPPLAS